jgi:NAD(P)H dehydrogenase (quinone)
MFDPDPRIKVLVVYYSRFGVVQRLAECVAEGARKEEGAEVELLEVGDHPIEEVLTGESEAEMARRRAAILNRLASADALIVGAPGYYGSMASPVKRFFEDCGTASDPLVTDRTRPWRHFNLHSKIGAAFTSTATPHGGNEQALLSILTMFMHFGMILVTPGQQQPILENDSPPYGGTAVTGPEGDRPPTKSEEQTARKLGQRVAQVAIALKLGSVRYKGADAARGRARTYGADHPL